nr:Chain U, Tribbles homolog 1 [Homo sapiens]5IGO_V Chain V, Tribbles homolog 1 [Homo sapiens]5IGO_W Chain W, Tribbles homolog 1 [Homo sapiens]5IGO_X Chain X, Tribbles homolog 1 [Homo sapiens]5IGQ_V Chain V, Tribbles homolog 1 [Homo sapiens]5IGQ_W Chain W, Tribbles homolog 1 [Homo sapiens]5IGQ_X Chain X, Tribbles homolog 1 [Homo sapiens]5IGQ_Y Chain Y, Tribbles homolog 1 [Homo sapiens]5IGQ_Z Chain Z, Tribbles homolog 1 [Homo sapiens]
SDQIVPEY